MGTKEGIEAETGPVRVLAVVTTRFDRNGISSVVRSLSSRIPPLDASFDYVLMNEPSPEDREALTARGERIFVLPRRNLRPLAYVRALSGIARRGGYDVLHAHGNSATLYLEMLAAKRAGVPVRVPHSHNTATGFPLVHRLLLRPFRAALTDPLACGEAAGRWLYGNLPFTILDNGIDTDRFTFRPEDRRSARAGLPVGSGRVYAHVGSFNRAKNHPFLLDAFAALHAADPSARLLLAGGGDARGAMIVRAEKSGLGGAVLFLPPGTDVKDVYAAADAFLLPSLHEGLPLTLLEAQSMGLPCLSSDAVTREADVLGLVRFARLADGAEAFARAAAALPVRPDAKRAGSSRAMREAGRDAADAASALTAFYRRALRRAAGG